MILSEWLELIASIGLAIIMIGVLVWRVKKLAEAGRSAAYRGEIDRFWINAGVAITLFYIVFLIVRFTDS